MALNDLQQREDESSSFSSSRHQIRSAQQHSAVDSRFSCNICFDSVVEPVVTQCGHLYCWPCLFKWLEPGMTLAEKQSLGIILTTSTTVVNASRRVCPVCKSSCNLNSLVPIYVRSNEEDMNSGGTLQNSMSGERNTSDQDEGNFHQNNMQGDNQDASSSENINDMQHVEDDPTSTTGLRQRARTVTSSTTQSASDNNNTSNSVPSRPAASTPQEPLSPVGDGDVTTATQQQPRHAAARTGANGDRNPVWLTPLSPTAHGASLSNGLLLSLAQQQYYRDDDGGGGVPSLHHRRRHQHQYGAEDDSQEMVPPGATEYLSRLLIMLASFVLLCLLML